MTLVDVLPALARRVPAEHKMKCGRGSNPRRVTADRKTHSRNSAKDLRKSAGHHTAAPGGRGEECIGVPGLWTLLDQASKNLCAREKKRLPTFTERQYAANGGTKDVSTLDRLLMHHARTARTSLIEHPIFV